MQLGGRAVDCCASLNNNTAATAHVGSSEARLSTQEPTAYLIQGELLNHAIPAAALSKECKDLMLTAVIQNRLDSPRAPHVQTVAPNLQPWDPAGRHAGYPCVQGGRILPLTSAYASYRLCLTAVYAGHTCW